MARRDPKSGELGDAACGSTAAKAGLFKGDAAESIEWRLRRLLLAQEVTPLVVRLVADTYGRDGLAEAWDEFRACDTGNDRGTPFEFATESPFFEYFTSWLAHNWRPTITSKRPKEVAVPEHVPAQTFLGLRKQLDPILVKYVKACIETPFSFFEVLSSDPGQRLTCWDLLSGGQQLVLESGISVDLHECHILYARIVEVDGTPVMDAVAPSLLAAEDLKPAILALRKMILEHASDADPAHIRRRLLAHEQDVRSFYWGFMEQAMLGGSLR